MPAGALTSPPPSQAHRSARSGASLSNIAAGPLQGQQLHLGFSHLTGSTAIFIGLTKALARTCKQAKLSAVTVHTLRHSFASIATELGLSEPVIAGLLGHSAGSVTSGYIHLDSALVTAATSTADVIAGALDGKASAKSLWGKHSAPIVSSN